MILRDLQLIGKATFEPIPLNEKSVITEDIRNYLTITYNEKPNNLIFKVKINLETFFDSFSKVYKNNCTKKIIELIIKKRESLKTEEVNNEKLREIIINEFNNDNDFAKLVFDSFKNTVEITPEEYKPENETLYLRGNRKGTSIYLSPTIFENVGYNKNNHKLDIDSIPLWKIRLNVNIEHSDNPSSPTNEEQAIINFFNLFPSINEYLNYESVVNLEDISFQKFIIPIVLSKIIVENTKIDNLKKGYYYFILCFNNKWPGEHKILVNYYNSQIKTEIRKDGKICGCCGELKNDVAIGPTEELGFFTNDQKGFKLGYFHENSQYEICAACQQEIIAGFNYINQELTFWAKKPSKQEEGIEYYLIPIISGDAINIDKSIQLLRTTLKNLKNTRDQIALTSLNDEINQAKILDRAKSEITDSNKSKKKLSKLTIKVKEQPEPKSVDLIELFEKVNVDSMLSFRIILFSHPSGQSKAYHNIYDVINISRFHFDKLKDSYSKLQKETWWNNPFNKPEKFQLWKLKNVFGDHKFKMFYSALIGGSTVSRNELIKNARLNIRRSFFQEALELSDTTYEDAKYFIDRMTVLNQYLFLMKELNLLNE